MGAGVSSLGEPLVGITGPFEVLLHATNKKGRNTCVEVEGPLPDRIQRLERNTEGHCSRLGDAALVILFIFNVVRNILPRTQILTSLLKVSGGPIRRLLADRIERWSTLGPLRLLRKAASTLSNCSIEATSITPIVPGVDSWRIRSTFQAEWQCDQRLNPLFFFLNAFPSYFSAFEFYFYLSVFSG